MSHFVSLKYFSSKELNELLDLAAQMKTNPKSSKSLLEGKSVGLLFEKSSLRTKTAFYIGAQQLGAKAIYYSPEEVKLGQREEVADVARTLSVYLDAVVVRTFSHSNILKFSEISSIPVVNALSDLLHPSQALADILTIQELKGDLRKLKVAYIGDGNNVCNSLIYAFSILGGNLHLAIPKGYQPYKSILDEVKSYHRVSGAKINLTDSSLQVAKDADVLYTDVWTSMGKEQEKSERKKAFKNFRIDDKILNRAKADAIVMHCLPAHRGEEITSSVIDGKSSVVFQQAENRLHTAKAILSYILKK
ncbi:MAG: ornithine carbamoyltransferase [Candidatus Omnitrophica bacterium]|nr:ornithine carbamoyltransferase [Candidatus Omnitrophota bacterium]